ncbi:MAG: serine hydrolase domain-containing protein [bacterium]
MEVHGFTAPGFERLRTALVRNFDKNDEVGAACCVYHRGEVVADLWAGDANRETGRAWQEDTLGIVFSATKGVTAMALNLLIERGRIDPEAPISHYWPEFEAAGKKDIPVSWLLAHRAGVPLIEAELTLEEVLAWDPVVEAIAAQKPIWEPGTKHGYHVRTYGWITGELVRRVTGKTFGEFLRDEITGPLQAEFFVGLAAELEPRVSRLIPPPEPEDERTRAAFLKFTGPDTLLGKALHGPSNLFHYDEMWNTRALHAAEMPSSNGIGTARGLAKLYAATIGSIDGIRLLKPETLANAIRPRSSGPDAILHLPSSFGLGFALGDFLSLRAGKQAFGHPGAGGSLGMADAEAGLAIAYIMNRMALGMTGDPRAGRLVKAAYDAIS